MTDSCSCPAEAGAQTCQTLATAATTACPTNGRIGRPIESLTLKALLSVPLTRVMTGLYCFCPVPDCPTVYYRHDSSQCFGETDLRERVFQKHPTDDDVFVCYCFRFTFRDIRKAAEKRRGPEILSIITDGIQSGKCACDIRNPQGTCCLGNVRAVINVIQSEIE